MIMDFIIRVLIGIAGLHGPVLAIVALISFAPGARYYEERWVLIGMLLCWVFGAVFGEWVRGEKK